MPVEAAGSSTMTWGTRVENTEFNGVTFRVYADRPRQISDMLHFAERWGDRPHIVHGDRVVTFAELLNAARTKAAELSSAGVGQGDCVVLVGFNSPDWVINFWAVTSLGAVPVLANAWWSSEELREALTLVRPALVLADERAALRLPDGWPTGAWECATGASPIGAHALPTLGVDENALAAVIFTSGTSGRPKAVQLAHRSLLSGLHMLLDITKRLPHLVTDKDGTTALHTGPMFHIGGIQTLLRSVIVGDTLIMPRGKFDPAEVLALIETWKVSRWSAVPTMVSRVLEHSDVRKRDVRTLRCRLPRRRAPGRDRLRADRERRTGHGSLRSGHSGKTRMQRAGPSVRRAEDWALGRSGRW
jgi:acyl-CoA synthetase (AMP-forming)/AMP-acid ligase II